MYKLFEQKSEHILAKIHSLVFEAIFHQYNVPEASKEYLHIITTKIQQHFYSIIFRYMFPLYSSDRCLHPREVSRGPGEQIQHHSEVLQRSQLSSRRERCFGLFWTGVFRQGYMHSSPSDGILQRAYGCYCAWCWCKYILLTLTQALGLLFFGKW